MHLVRNGLDVDSPKWMSHRWATKALQRRRTAGAQDAASIGELDVSIVIIHTNMFVGYKQVNLKHIMHCILYNVIVFDFVLSTLIRFIKKIVFLYGFKN